MVETDAVVLSPGQYYCPGNNCNGMIHDATAYARFNDVPFFIKGINYKTQYRYRDYKNLEKDTNDTEKGPILKVTSRSHKAILTWTKVPGATKYIVYHSVKKGTKWKSLGAKNVKKKLKITNTNLKKKSVHKYRVKAVVKNKGKTYKLFSMWKSVKVK